MMVSSMVLSPMILAVQWYLLSSIFDHFQVNSIVKSLQQLIFRWNNACDPMAHSVVDLNDMQSECTSISSPSHMVVGGTSHRSRYRKASYDHIDRVVPCMEDNHPVGIAEKWKKPQVLRDFTKDPKVCLWYHQHVALITVQYELAIYLRAVDYSLASTRPLRVIVHCPHLH